MLALFSPVYSGVYSLYTDVCFAALTWKQLLMRVQRGNLWGKSSCSQETGPLREFNCFYHLALQISIYLQYFLTMEHENVRNWWGKRDGAVVFSRKLKLHKDPPVWGLLDNHLQHSCFYSSFFSSSMLRFISLCNWANLWNSAAYLLVWWCWNEKAVAKLTCFISRLLRT